LNDILKAAASSSEVSEYQNIILPGLLSAVSKYCEFKDKILERLRVPKSQPTIKEAFDKCDRDVIAKKLSEHEVVLNDCARLNKETSEKIDYFMRIKMVDNVPKVVECVSPLQSAYQKARERFETPEVAADTPEVAADTPEVAADTPEVAADTPEVAAEDTPNIQITFTDIEAQEEFLNELYVETPTVVADEETEEVVSDQAPDGETEEVVADQAPDGETEEVVADQAPDGETEEDQAPDEDVSEEEIEADEQEEEVEEYTHKGKKYYVTNTTNGKIYACTADDDIGDQVGTFKNGKPIFS